MILSLPYYDPHGQHNQAAVEPVHQCVLRCLGQMDIAGDAERHPRHDQEVNWLAWQTPYWEQAAPDRLKQEREASRAETIKRIKMNVPVALLLTEERFQ